jgi:hypothetical protein
MVMVLATGSAVTAKLVGGSRCPKLEDELLEEALELLEDDDDIDVDELLDELLELDDDELLELEDDELLELDEDELLEVITSVLLDDELLEVNTSVLLELLDELVMSMEDDDDELEEELEDDDVDE